MIVWPGGGLCVLQAGAFVKVPARVLTSSPELRGAGMFSNYVHRLVQFHFAAVHPPSYGKTKLNSEIFYICDMFCTSFTAATPYHLRPLGNLTEPWHIGNWNLVDSLQGWTEVQRVECGKMVSVYIDMCWFHSTTSTQTCAKSGEWLKTICNSKPETLVKPWLTCHAGSEKFGPLERDVTEKIASGVPCLNFKF